MISLTGQFRVKGRVRVRVTVSVRVSRNLNPNKSSVEHPKAYIL
jgi:hypothetical protein